MLKLIIFLFFIIPAITFSQVDSITITHHWEYYDGDTTIEDIVDSFATGIHVSEYVHDVNNNPISRTNYTYGLMGLIDSSIEKFTNGAWENFLLMSNQFYPNDSLNITTRYIYIYNYITTLYDTSARRQTITYDTITNSKSILQEERTYNSPWAVTRRENYTYDVQYRLQYYFVEDANLQPSWDKAIYYLPNDSVDYYIFRTYTSGVVSNTDSVTYIYNTNGFLENEITYQEASPTWQLQEMLGFTYDANNNMLSSSGYLWSDSTTGWYLFPDSTWYTYNAFNQMTESMTTYAPGAGGGSHEWYFYDGSNRLDSAYYVVWPHGGDTRYNSYKMEYPVWTIITSTTARQHMQLFPNPATDKIVLNCPDGVQIRRIDIRDAMGRLVETQQCFDLNISIDVSKLPAGVYFVTGLFGEDEESLVRMVKGN